MRRSDVHPPTMALFVNNPELITEEYRRYFVRQLTGAAAVFGGADKAVRAGASSERGGRAGGAGRGGGGDRGARGPARRRKEPF